MSKTGLLYEEKIQSAIVDIDAESELKVAGRNVWRSSNKTATYRSTYKVPVSIIRLIKDWNPRTVFDGIMELAENIVANGLIEPLQGDLSADGQLFFIRNGERRFRAILYAIDFLDYKIDQVEVIPYSSRHSELDKLIENLSSDKKSKYDHVDMSAAIVRLKEKHQLTNAEIAQRLGYSRQWVDNMILFNEYWDKESVRAGAVHFSDAITSIRDKKKSEKAEVQATTTVVPPVEPPQTTIPSTETPEEIEEQDNGEDGVKPGDWKQVPSVDHSHAQEIGAGVLGPDKKDKRDRLAEMNKELAGLSDDLDDDEYKSEEDNISKSLNWCLNKMEGIAAGLNEEAKKDFDGLMHHMRNEIEKATTVSHLYGNKFDRVSHELITELVKKSTAPGKVSDGYHSFDDLYNHRHALCVAISNLSISRNICWRSEYHSDGTRYEGWFIFGIYTEAGKQITYHVPMELWNDFASAEVLDRAPEYDGHSSQNCIERLKFYL